MGIYIGVFNTRRYTLVHAFCFFKLFPVGGKELIDERHVEEGGTVVSLNNTVVTCKRTLADAPFLLQRAWIMYSCALVHTLYNT